MSTFHDFAFGNLLKMNKTIRKLINYNLSLENVISEDILSINLYFILHILVTYIFVFRFG